MWPCCEEMQIKTECYDLQIMWSHISHHKDNISNGETEFPCKHIDAVFFLLFKHTHSQGQCRSKSSYSLEKNRVESQCVCCAATGAVPLSVALLCPNGTHIPHQVLTVTGCDCQAQACPADWKHNTNVNMHHWNTLFFFYKQIHTQNVITVCFCNKTESYDTACHSLLQVYLKPINYAVKIQHINI